MTDWLRARNILAVRLDNMGDVVMIGPALRGIKRCSPDAQITLLASPAGTRAAALLPWIDATITWRPIWQDVHGQIPDDPRREQEFIDVLSARRFDAALIFTSFSQTPHVAAYVCLLAGIPLRAGESREFGGRTMTTEINGTPDSAHQVERNVRLVEAVGFQCPDQHLQVRIPAESSQSAARLLSTVGIDCRRPYILLHPGASAQARRYPPERSATVARLLTQSGWQVVVTGVERETPLLDTIQRLTPEARYLIGTASLSEYAALIHRASAVICGNTLPMHLADATGTPAVVLYSGTDLEEQWRPRSVPHVLLRRPTPCHPCYLFQCPLGQPCLDIEPSEVVRAVEQLAGALSVRGGAS